MRTKFGGVQVLISKFLPRSPKKLFLLSPHIEVSEAFRAKHNQKMLALFGAAPVIIRHYTNPHQVIVNPEAFELLKKVTKNER